MKRRLVLLLTITLIMGLIGGCGETGDYTDKSGMSFKALDYVTLSDYKGLDAYDVEVGVTDEELDAEVESTLEDYIEYIDVTDRGIEYEDSVNFDYSAAVNDEAVSDCAEKDYQIQVGVDEFNEDIADSMIGHKVGDVYTVKTAITEDLGESKIGELAVFTITINSIQIEKLPELTDSFVKEKTEYKTVDEFKDSVKKGLLESKSEEYMETIKQGLLDTIVKNSTFKDERPKELKEICKEACEADVASQAEMFGKSAEEFKSIFYEDGEFDESVASEVDLRLVVYAIAEKEKLFYNKNGIKKYKEEQAKAYEYDSVDEYVNDTGDDVISYESTYYNVVDFLYKNAKIKKVDEETYKKENPDIYDEEVSDDEDSDSDEVTEESDEEVGSSDESEDLEDVSEEEEPSVEVTSSDEVNSLNDEENSAVTEAPVLFDAN